MGESGQNGTERHADGKYRRKDGDEVSRIVSERTCRGNTRSRGKRKRGKESKSTTTAVNIYMLLAEKKAVTV